MNEVLFFMFFCLCVLVGGDDPRQWSEDNRGECEGQETLPLPRRSEVSIYNFSFLLQHWLWMLSHCYLKGIRCLCHLLTLMATFLNNKNKKGVCQALKTHKRSIEIVHMTVALYRKSSEANLHKSRKHHAASSSAH